VYLIRHAEATHNQRFREAAEQPERHDELKAAGYNVEDSPLTAAGVAQAAQLREKLREEEGFGLVVSSPMRRALQTTRAAFGDAAGGAGAEAGAGAAAGAGAESPRVVQVCALHRERDGGLLRRCDSGSLRSVLEPEFGGSDRGVAFDFGELAERWCLRHTQLLEMGEAPPITAETVGAGGQNAHRESVEALEGRIDAFAAWLRRRPERRIAVVGHGDYWKAFTERVFGRPIRLDNCGWVAWDGVGRDAELLGMVGGRHVADAREDEATKHGGKQR